MRFCLIHVDDDGSSDELAVLVPGAAARTAIMVALGALPDFLPILEEVTAELGEQGCAKCGAPLPGLGPAEADGG